MTDQELLAEIKLAYKTHRLRPIHGFFYIRRGDCTFACPLVALAIHRGIMDGVEPGFEFHGGALDAGSIEAIEWAAAHFGEKWVTGFLAGFDRQDESSNDEKYLEGYGFGEVLAQEILPNEEKRNGQPETF
jgi:hypothetical protein